MLHPGHRLWEPKGGNIDTLWISAAVLCSAPAATGQDRASWRASLGGPLHPIIPLLSAAKFPASIPLAAHIRVQGAGEALLEVWVEDSSGAVIEWGPGQAEPAREHVFLVSDNLAGAREFIFEDAKTALLAGVAFPSEGRYSLVARLVSLASLELGAVRLPLVVVRDPSGVSGGPRRRAPAPRVPDRIERLLAPRALRALRLAAAESARLGRSSVIAEALLIALRRVLGRRSGLPSTAALRDAAEEMVGVLYRTPVLADLRLGPEVVELIDEASSGGSRRVDCEELLAATLGPKGLMRDFQGRHLLIERALLLGTRSPL